MFTCFLPNPDKGIRCAEDSFTMAQLATHFKCATGFPCFHRLVLFLHTFCFAHTRPDFSVYLFISNRFALKARINKISSFQSCMFSSVNHIARRYRRWPAMVDLSRLEFLVEAKLTRRRVVGEAPPVQRLCDLNV